MESVEAFAKAAEAEWLCGLGPDTESAYRRDLGLWLDYCRQAGIDPNNPTRLAVKAFADLQAAKYRPLSVRRTLAALSSCYATLSPDGRNPFARRAIRRPPATDYEETKIISDDEAARVIAAAGERGETPLRDAAILWVLWSTGMRRSSVVSIPRNVERRDGVLVVRHRLKGQEEPAHSELSPEAARAVEAWLLAAPPSRWLFCRMDNQPKGRQRVGQRRAPETGEQHPALSPSAVTAILARAAKAVGLSLHPHQFRVAAITQALDAGIPVERVRAFVHHKDIRSTLRYDRGARGAGVAAEVAAFRARRTKEE